MLKVIRDLISISRSFLCRMQIGKTEADSLLNSFIYSFAPSVNKYLVINSLEKTLMLGKIGGRRRRGRQRMRWLDGITDSVDLNLSKLRETVKDWEIWRATVHRFAKSQT